MYHNSKFTIISQEIKKEQYSKELPLFKASLPFVYFRWQNSKSCERVKDFVSWLSKLSLLGVNNPFAMMWWTYVYIFLKLVDISTKLSSFFLCRPPDEKTYLVRVIGEGSIGEIVVWIQHLLLHEQNIVSSFEEAIFKLFSFFFLHNIVLQCRSLKDAITKIATFLFVCITPCVSSSPIMSFRTINGPIVNCVAAQ